MKPRRREITDWATDHEATYYALYWWPWIGRRPRHTAIEPGHCPCGCGAKLHGKQKAASATCRQRLRRKSHE